MLDLTPETPADWWEVEALFDLCFAPGREALSSYRLRDDANPVAALCFLIRDETGALGGAIRYWPVSIAQQPALLLGPVAVHPTRQGEGLGGFLIRESLKIAHHTPAQEQRQQDQPGNASALSLNMLSAHCASPLSGWSTAVEGA